jgi:hypothetical protein
MSAEYRAPFAAPRARPPALKGFGRGGSCVMRLKPVRAATKCRAKHESAVGEAETPYCCLDGHLPPLSGKLREPHPVRGPSNHDNVLCSAGPVRVRYAPAVIVVLLAPPGYQCATASIGLTNDENVSPVTRRSFNRLPSPGHRLSLPNRGKRGSVSWATRCHASLREKGINRAMVNIGMR